MLALSWIKKLTWVFYTSPKCPNTKVFCLFFAQNWAVLSVSKCWNGQLLKEIGLHLRQTATEKVFDFEFDFDLELSRSRESACMYPLPFSILHTSDWSVFFPVDTNVHHSLFWQQSVIHIHAAVHNLHILIIFLWIHLSTSTAQDPCQNYANEVTCLLVISNQHFLQRQQKH